LNTTIDDVEIKVTLHIVGDFMLNESLAFDVTQIARNFDFDLVNLIH